jgi:hypothetical protein
MATYRNHDHRVLRTDLTAKALAGAQLCVQ